MTIDHLKALGGKPGTSRARSPAPAARSHRDAYHHGDLRAALIAAAQDELAENGVEDFTLRGCARRAGVSHAAPAHHFKDVRALLTELAAIGFTHLAEITARFGEAAPKGTIEHLVEIGRGYVTFAARHPQEFHLIFRADRLDRDSEAYRSAANAAFAVPVAGVGAYYGSADPMAEPALQARVIGLWSLVHGFSDLMLSGVFDGNVRGDRTELIDGLVPDLVRQFFAGDATSRRAGPLGRRKPSVRIGPDCL